VNDRHLSKQSSVYQYRLLQRIHYKSYYYYAYWLLPVLLLGWGLVQMNPWPMATAGIAIPLLHLIITWLSLRTMDGRAPKHWGWSFHMPWWGYRPSSYVSLEKLLSLHLQLLLITFVIIGCLFPWVSTELLSRLLFVHLWLLLPRFIILLRFSKHSKIGYIKINESDTSCYAQ
jgi:hypothetical protein